MSIIQRHDPGELLGFLSGSPCPAVTPGTPASRRGALVLQLPLGPLLLCQDRWVVESIYPFEPMTSHVFFPLPPACPHLLRLGKRSLLKSNPCDFSTGDPIGSTDRKVGFFSLSLHFPAEAHVSMFQCFCFFNKPI